MADERDESGAWKTRRIFVVCGAPNAPGRTAGFGWRRTHAEALHLFATVAADAGLDVRLTALPLPDDLTAPQIDDFLSSPYGRALLDPPDPRVDLDSALDLWRHGDDPSELDREEDTDTVTLALTVPASQAEAVEDAIDALLDQGTIQDAILERVADLDSLDVEILAASCRRGG